jgi:antitoxin ParD1/3/4
MAEGVNVRFTGELQKFIRSRIDASGLYNSAREYLRDLVRRDYERDEARKWDSLRAKLKAGMEAEPSEFVPLDIEKVISTAKKRKKAGSKSNS